MVDKYNSFPSFPTSQTNSMPASEPPCVKGHLARRLATHLLAIFLFKVSAGDLDESRQLLHLEFVILLPHPGPVIRKSAQNEACYDSDK
jgi:hypothetical protein